MAVPIIINCRDRLTPLADLVDCVERAEQDRIVLLDNDSAWAPVRDYYEHTPREVVRLRRNLGSQAPWVAGITDRFDTVHAVTDPHIVPSDERPRDLLGHLADVLRRHPDRVKVGIGTDDLQASYWHTEDAP